MKYLQLINELNFSSGLTWPACLYFTIKLAMCGNCMCRAVGKSCEASGGVYRLGSKQTCTMYIIIQLDL